MQYLHLSHANSDIDFRTSYDILYNGFIDGLVSSSVKLLLVTFRAHCGTILNSYTEATPCRMRACQVNVISDGNACDIEHLGTPKIILHLGAHVACKER